MSQHRSQQEWLRLVQKYYNSEQSAAQFCLEHNLHPKTFDNNRRKLHHLVNLPKKREDSLSECIFRSYPTAYFGFNRPPNPFLTDHSFRF
ncbi:IS66 family insertion sequence element accessory protein TnpA (plasmid) [Vibrio sp. nBUS_14]|uniref:IS66 family insertion sequence element accessory protein TnpA n=1 Tax=Vibrio sp. nBUS_14 TaxID=3395321 RepID=UPI003EBC81C2